MKWMQKTEFKGTVGVVSSDPPAVKWSFWFRTLAFKLTILHSVFDILYVFYIFYIYCIYCIFFIFCIYCIFCIHCIYCIYCIFCIYCIYCRCILLVPYNREYGWNRAREAGLPPHHPTQGTLHPHPLTTLHHPSQ